MKYDEEKGVKNLDVNKIYINLFLYKIISKLVVQYLIYKETHFDILHIIFQQYIVK